MPRQIKTEVKNKFNMGLITETTGLQSPENSCEETDNCVFHYKGNIFRRYGIDFEPGYSTKIVGREGVVIRTFLWQNAAGLADKNFLVVQVGGVLYFYTTGQDAVSTGAYSLPVDFSVYATGDPTLCGTVECQFAFGQGYLFVTNPFADPTYITYNTGTDSFSITRMGLLVRDVKGVVELGVSTDTRPTSLTSAHTYNLYNQGWAPTSTVDYVNTWRGSGTLLMGGATGTARSDYPSNADIWWLYRNSSDVFDRSLPDKRSRGNTPAPKGHYLYNAFNIDRSVISGVSGLTVTSAGANRPKSVCFFAGRVWYGGVDAQGFSTTVYFSQVLTDISYAGNCYQQNDPTNEYLFDLLATDGGTIEILEVGSIIKLVPMQTSVLVFSTNGVWSISGNQGIGFTPSDFTVRKVSSIPALSAGSFVDFEGMPVWWNNDGIYAVTGANAAGAVTIESLTETTIKTFYNSIPVDNKANAKGYYNPLTRQIQWLYRSYTADTVTEKYEYDKALFFNATTKAFYVWTFPNKAVTINGLVSFKTPGTDIRKTYTLDDYGKPALDSHGEPVYTLEYQTSLKASVFKYLVSSHQGSDFKITFAEEWDADYADFQSLDNTGADYISYFITNGDMDGEAQRRFQNNYIFVYAKPNSEINLQAYWDYAHSVTSGDYSPIQKLTYIDMKRDHYFKKVKIRGAGRALQLKFSSVSGKPFDMSGWSTYITQNSQP